MRKQVVTKFMLVFALALVTTSTGCMFCATGPSLGPLSIPIPVSPYFQYRKENQAFEERYKGTKVLPPIPPGQPHYAEDPPSEDEVIRKFHEVHPVSGNWPGLYEVQHNNVRIVIDKLQDTVDSPVVHPALGPVQVHHAHYRCRVYYTEIIRNGWPLPYSVKDEEKMEVLYIDHDHYHMVGNVDAPNNGM